MKTLTMGLVTLIFMGLTQFANAQSSVYTNPEECSADVGALDVNNDGYVTDAEMAGRGTIETNVDTDGVGRISRDEMTVACNDKTMQALKPKQ